MRGANLIVRSIFSTPILLSSPRHVCQEGGQYQSSANTAGRGRYGGNRGRGGNNRGRGRGGRGNNSNNGGNAPKKSGSTSKPKCQICKIVGHEAPQCWYCYDDDLDDQQNNKTAGAANSQLWVRH